MSFYPILFGHVHELDHKLEYLLLTTAVCSPACQGGGTCVAPNTCQCPDGLEGNVCGSGMYLCV